MARNDAIRPVVRGYYDLQKLRIMTGQRVVSSFKAKLGIKPGQKEDDVESEDAKALLKTLRQSYTRISDAMASQPASRREFVEDGLIGTLEEFSLIRSYLNLERAEKESYAAMETIVEAHPIHAAFLKNVRGVGPAMAAVLISEIDIEKAKYPSSLYRFAGVDCVGGPLDGEGRTRKAEHLVEVEYLAKDGSVKKRMSITFNPFLKTKLLGVLATNFLRAGEDSPYERVYRDYRNRIDNHPKHSEKRKAHRHRMALRYMIKIFLKDLYTHWREVEGLPVHEPYGVAKLGLARHESLV